MKVELLDFVRPEMKFESIDALKAFFDAEIVINGSDSIELK